MTTNMPSISLTWLIAREKDKLCAGMLQSKGYTHVKNTSCICEWNSWMPIDIMRTWRTASAYWRQYLCRPLTMIHRVGVHKVLMSLNKCLPCIHCTQGHEGQYRSWFIMVIQWPPGLKFIYFFWRLRMIHFFISMIYGTGSTWVPMFFKIDLCAFSISASSEHKTISILVCAFGWSIHSYRHKNTWFSWAHIVFF